MKCEIYIDDNPRIENNEIKYDLYLIVDDKNAYHYFTSTIITWFEPKYISSVKACFRHFATFNTKKDALDMLYYLRYKCSGKQTKRYKQALNNENLIEYIV